MGGRSNAASRIPVRGVARGPRPTVRSGLGWVFLLSALSACLCLSSAESKPVGHDRIWRSAGLARARVRLVALLPVVSETDDRPAERLAGECLERQYELSGRPRIRTTESAERLEAAARHDSLLRAVSKQVWRKGRVDSTTARMLTRELGADAFLTVRINRWERWAGTGPTHMRAFVDLSAALTDSSGVLLWKASGREAVKTPGEILAKLDTRPGAWRLAERYGLDTVPEDFRDAVSALVARWLPLVPPPPS